MTGNWIGLDWTGETKQKYKGPINIVVYREGWRYEIRPYLGSLKQEEIERFRRDRNIIEIITGVNKDGLDVINRMVFNSSKSITRGENVRNADFRLSEGLWHEFLVDA